MSILQVFNSCIQKHGSFEDFMIELARKAKEENIKLNFTFPVIETQEIKGKLESLGAKIYVIKNNWSSFRFIRELLKIILKEKPNLLDFHFCYSLNFTVLFLLLRVLRIKIVYHYHGEIIPIEELRFRNRYFSKLKLLTFFVNKIICVSGANKRFLEALNIRKKIYVVYNGIDVDNFIKINIDRDFKKEMGFNNGELIITSIGSLISRKGIDVLIRAVKYVAEEIPQARFIIIGAGSKEKYQRLAENLGIKDKVIFTGLLKEYPYYILKASDLYVSASFAESFGLSIAEAQLLGIPAVATRVGGVPEVVHEGKTGLLSEAGDSRGLSNQIIKLLKDESLRKEFAAAAREWVKERFALKDKVEELFAHFSKGTIIMDANIVTYQPDNFLKKGLAAIFKEIVYELKNNRWLTYQLFKRKFMAEYKQSALGIFWKFITPFISVGTFILLNHTGIFSAGDIHVPYPLYAMAGLIFWQIFATGIVAGAGSLVNSSALITHINLSKKSLVIAETANTFVTLLIQLVLLALMFLFYQKLPSRGILLIPIVIFSLISFTLGLNFIFSLFESVIRDIRTSLLMAVTFLMLLTPVMYTKPQAGILMKITKFNPLYYMVSAGRDLVLTGSISELKGFIISIFISIFILIVCITLFHITESRISERI